MANEVYILCCDIDAQSHGAFSSQEKAIEHAEELIAVQPFHMECELCDFYLDAYEIDSDNKESEMIDL